jgi:hypothetical protein
MSTTRAGVTKVRSGGEDEQVERFFVLLANIRALRNVHGAAISGSSSAECQGRKRARETEPSPWRPVFRMEDFALAHKEVSGRRPVFRMESSTC